MDRNPVNGGLAAVTTRLAEPSTWAAAAAALSALGVSLPPGVWKDLSFAGLAVSAVLGVGFREGWKKALEDGDLVKAVGEGLKNSEAVGHASK